MPKISPQKQKLIRIGVVMNLLLFLQSFSGCGTSNTNRSEAMQSQPLTTVEGENESGHENSAYGHLAGISNIGNTCYMNAMLQVWAALYPSIFDKDHSNIGQAGKAILTKINAGKENVTRVEVENFINALKEQGVWDALQQHDAEEFFTKVLALASINVKPMQTYIITQYNDGKGKLFTKAEEGDLYLLQVPINFSYPLSIQEQFDLTVQPEKVNDYRFEWDENWVAENVGLNPTQEGTVRNLKYGNIKGVLPIHLKRYTNDLKKITNPIQEPCKLTVKPAHIIENEKIEFKLGAFIVQTGSLSGGHYIAYVQKDQQWYCADDSCITVVGASSAEDAAKNAYLLFYKRES